VEQKNKRYETTVIINPTLEEHQIEGIIKNVEEMITKNNGSIVTTERWGRKRLTYPIDKRNNGYYAHIDFESDTNIITDLERNFEYDENIMRYLTIRLDSKMIEAKEQQKLKPRDPEEQDQTDENFDDIDVTVPDDDAVEPSPSDEGPEKP